MFDWMVIMASKSKDDGGKAAEDCAVAPNSAVEDSVSFFQAFLLSSLPSHS
jgi:hypothetical protein